MTTLRHRAALLVCAPFFVVGPGCHEPEYPDPAEIVWEGDFIAYAEEPGALQVCAGTIPWTDRFVGALASELEVDLEDPLLFYRLTKETAQSECPAGAARCAGGGRVYTWVGVERHEPVHALRQIKYGPSYRGHTFFEEGLADLFQDITGSAIVPHPDDVAAGIAVSSGFLPPEYYRTAQHFVSYLANVYGVGPTERLVTAATSSSDFEAVDEIFRGIVATPLDDVIAEYRAEYPVCSAYARARHPLECDEGEPVVIERISGGGRVERDMMSCSDPDVLGTMGDGEAMWTYATFELVEGGHYFIELTDPTSGGETESSSFQAEVIACDGGCFDPLDYRASAPDSELHELQPGRYLVRFSRDSDDPGPVSLGVSPACLYAGVWARCLD